VNEAINDVKAIAMSGTLAMYYRLAINTWPTLVLVILKYLLTEKTIFFFDCHSFLFSSNKKLLKKCVYLLKTIMNIFIMIIIIFLLQHKEEINYSFKRKQSKIKSFHLKSINIIVVKA
jgi:glycerol-3-phosphate acyltransferase PlsY